MQKIAYENHFLHHNAMDHYEILTQRAYLCWTCFVQNSLKSVEAWENSDHFGFSKRRTGGVQT